MRYEDKYTCTSQAPDSVDIEKCPVYQRWVTEQQLKDQMKQIIENDITENDRVIYGNS